ncbi:MAG: histidine phosphatase family protein [Saprospiraceae bacterium]|nr:histidine phosphatase family protein [Bacteroidia bacterium]NNE16508.1 histidine phosphatase family protein [Saprospiraceae bacterium]NNL91954.1 histidine phosphatase family protein [Saprospiraceae bacterium]
MKEFLLVRHAKSSWKHPHLKDKERPLNPRGERDAPRMAAYCKDNGLALTNIISSPAVRAFTTASIFSEIYGNLDVDIETDLYFGEESDWLDIINQLDEDIKFPAFFSHNPTITYFANSFEGDYIDNVPTCGVVHIKSSANEWSEVDCRNSKIESFIYPKGI